MPRVVSFINYKGGVGKTTTAYHVACSLAQHYNQKVLLIDIDPQTNLTFLCVDVNQWRRRKRNTGTIRDLYRRYVDNQQLDVSQYIWNNPVTVRRFPIRGLDLIPCDIDLLGEDLGEGQPVGTFPTFEALKRNANEYVRGLSFLKQVIAEAGGKYHWVIIDCPPNLYLMTQNALHASDYYVVTAIPDHLSTIGMNILINKVSRIGQTISSACTLAGQSRQRTIAELGAIIFVKVRIGGSLITTTHEDTISRVSSQTPTMGLVVRTHTTELIGYSEAAENRIPVWEHTSQNARLATEKNQYPEITNELIQRLR